MNNIPSREELFKECQIFAMLRKLSGSDNWSTCPGELFRSACKYEREVVEKYYPDEANIIWNEAFKPKFK